MSNLDNLIQMLYTIREADKITSGILFYDETNNFRKFKLTKKGLNNNVYEKSCFVLGGLYIEDKYNIDINTLMIKLKPQKSIKEFKFKYFSNNSINFFDILNSNRLLTLLQWISEQGILIHYTLFDYIYYSSADIVDSLPDARNTLNFNRELKNTLYIEIRNNLELFLELFYKYNYPNIKRESHREFMHEIYNLYTSKVVINPYLPSDFFKELLRQMLKSAISAPNLVFLQDNTDYLLFEEYENLYIDAPINIPNSHHIFDEEIIIKDKLLRLDKDFEKKLNMSFQKSDLEIFIQLSDVIVGFISK